MLPRPTIVLIAAVAGCGDGGRSPRPTSAYPGLNRAVADANDRLEAKTPRWQPLQRAEVLGRTFEAFRLGADGPRFVWIPSAGEAVSMQTWIGHPVRTDGASMALLEGAVRALRYGAEQNKHGVRARIGRDSSRLNVRTVAAPTRWSKHLAFHADWLCRPKWSNQDLERALAHTIRLQGWARIGARLTRAGWRARGAASKATRPTNPELLRRMLRQWLTPSGAVVVVAGPVDRKALLLAAASQFDECANARRTAQNTESRPRPRRRRSVRVPGPFRHALVSWTLPKMSAREAAAVDGLALWLADERRGPLAEALVPDHAMGVAVRRRDHPAGTDLEVLMTLSPAATASAAVERTRSVFARQLDRNDPAWTRAQTGLRNRTLKQLSTLEGSGALAASTLIVGDTLAHLARRIEASTRLSGEDVQRMTSRHLLSEPPLVILGHPRNRRRR